ncbi:phage protein NinX family protein [Caballeronia sp. BR00000012568055]|uniref:phage protein NinX family protein n=1 Tax=Caballeronia sp. BR00000012568055 TaxID=2918761 RepID=UPI0023F7D122|nr:phage protein NinX family protein [Caballeronia sp. BR00000012568055]
MNTSDLEGPTLDYWVARGLHDFIREIHFTDSGETLSIRGNDRGKPWDGRFLPSTSWDAASVVLERACKLEMHDHGRGEVVCTVSFGKDGETMEGRGESLRTALLRAFVRHSFGDSVEDEYPRRPQALTGLQADPIEESSAVTSLSVEDMPRPEAHIGDIGSTPRQ